jgi:ribosomal protein S18 acetylase RimI-like enzyme
MIVRTPAEDDLEEIFALVTASDRELLGDWGGVGSELIRLTEERAVAEVPRYAVAPRVYLQNATADASDSAAGFYAARGYVPSRYQFRMVADLEVEPARGWVGSIGVLPQWRGRGIGEALLRTSFAEFWRRGERRVALGVDAHNAAATRLYERAGMHVLYRITLYEKELRGRDQAS